MKRKSSSYTSSAASLTGFASNVTGATWALTATVVGDSLAHKVTVRNDSSTNHTGKTITLVGTDADGHVQTETMAGPNNAATVTSTNYYLTLTSVTVDATIGADTFDIGWSAAAVSPSIYVGQLYDKSPALGISCDVTGTVAYSLQQSYGGNWYAHAVIATKTADADGSILFPVVAVRLIFTAASTAVVLNIVAL